MLIKANYDNNNNNQIVEGTEYNIFKYIFLKAYKSEIKTSKMDQNNPRTKSKPQTNHTMPQWATWTQAEHIL